MISVKIEGLEELRKKLIDYEKSLPQRERLCLERLAEIGIDTATVAFRYAEYDGTNDVVVQPFEWVGNKIIVSAIGNSITFIEFGTGTTFVYEHPLADEFGMIRGEYGQGKGKQDSWTYYGEAGTSGHLVKVRDGKTVIRTHGNPANRCMYNASKDIENNITRIVKEVYKFD